jgi:two-component system, LytTR family, response regulator
MIDCLIVDDEAPARRHLSRLLRDYPSVRVVGEAENGVEALQLIADHVPGVVFLDIEMPGPSGLDVVRQLSESPLIVFVTAYNHYAVAAFDANAIDYLLKPVTPQRLAQTLEKLRGSLHLLCDGYQAALQRALSTLRTAPISKLAATRGRRIVLLSLEDVLYIVAEHKLVFACTPTERLIVNRTIDQLETLLTTAGFIRTSRSVLMNVVHARELIPSSSGTWKVRLSNGGEVGVSRIRARQLRIRTRFPALH